MKKTGVLLLLLLVLAFALPLPTLAAELDAVTDAAGLLTDAERGELNDRAEELAAQYQCAVYIVTLEDMEDMGTSDAYDLATAVYTEYDLGYGEEKSGLLLLLSMAERDYALIAYGYGNTAFTDYGKDVLLDEEVLPLLGEDAYYEGFSAYLDTAGEYLSMARDGKPFDVENAPGYNETDGSYGVTARPKYDEGEFAVRLGAVILLPLLLAGGICLYWKRQMNTAVSARTADRYIPSDGFHLTGQQDTFLYRTETRRRIENHSSGGGHAGGTSMRSGGFSGRSGKF
ncbi:TPM domain-containing protein [Oscillibacter sp.]|uniref:TPM domain-containing protein n=1 Tax=Oscillibacter sp. TaxID=1945593 RepID=UPI00289A49F2|nr:TPM domain-containing protein [Oscillibacter sp.]